MISRDELIALVQDLRSSGRLRGYEADALIHGLQCIPDGEPRNVRPPSTHTPVIAPPTRPDRMSRMPPLLAVPPIEDGAPWGEKIAHARKTRGISQRQIADAINVSVQAISQWENGKTQPNPENYAALVDVLDIKDGVAQPLDATS